MPSRKGSPNRPKRLLLARLREEFPGYEPVLEIAKAANRLTSLAIDADNSVDPEVNSGAAGLWKDAGTQHEKVAQFVTPKLKAVEVTGEDGGPLEAKVAMLAGEMSAEEATKLYLDMLGED